MHIMLATHGKFSKGILDSYQMIAGVNDKIHAISLTDDGIEGFAEKLQNDMEDLLDDTVLVMTDLKGGTPYNEAFNYYLIHPESVRVVAGLNLPMLIEVGLALENNSLDTLYNLALATGAAGVIGIEEDSADNEIEF